MRSPGGKFLLGNGERQMAGAARAVQRHRCPRNHRSHGACLLRIEHEHHAVPAAEEDVPAILARIFFQADDPRIELLRRVEVGCTQAAFQHTQRFHDKPVNGPSPQKSGLPNFSMLCPIPCASESNKRLCGTPLNLSERPMRKPSPPPTSTKGM